MRLGLKSETRRKFSKQVKPTLKKIFQRIQNFQIKMMSKNLMSLLLLVATAVLCAAWPSGAPAGLFGACHGLQPFHGVMTGAQTTEMPYKISAEWKQTSGSFEITVNNQ